MKLESKNTISFSISLLVNLIELVLLLIILLFYSIRIPFVQNSIALQITHTINENLNSEIKIDEVSLRSFDYFQLNQILIPDLNGDTILFVPSAVIKVKKWNLLERSFHINKVLLKDPIINVKKNKGSANYEWKFLLKVFENTQRKSKNYNVKVDEIELDKATLTHCNYNKINNNQIFDYQCFKLFNLNLLLNKSDLNNAFISTKISHLNFLSDEKFNLISLNGNLYLDSNKINVSDVILNTSKSSLTAKEFNYFLNQNSFLEDEFNFSELSSNISAQDFNLFTNYKVDTNFELTVNTDLNASNTDLKFQNLAIKYLKSDLRGYLSFQNWKDPSSLAFKFDLHSNNIFKEDLFTLESYNYLKIPPLLKNKLQEIEDFKCSLIGDANSDELNSDFSFLSSVGKIFGSFDLHTNDISDVSYNMNLVAENFSGKLAFEGLDVENFNAQLKINGKGFYKEDVDLKIDGFFSDFIMNNYKYDDIFITGSFKNKAFNGFLQLKDQFIDLEFNGNIDFNSKPKEFDFSLAISNAYLEELGLLPSYPKSKLSFVSYFNGFGNDWKDFTGFVNLDSIYFYQNNTTHDFGSIQFNSQTNESDHLIKLRSDILSFDINGEFKFDELYTNFKYSVNRIIPNIFSNVTSVNKDQLFEFDLTVHDFQPINSLFHNNIDIAPNSFLKLRFSKKDNLSDFELKSSKIIWNDFEFKEIDAIAKMENKNSMDNNLSINVNVDSVNSSFFNIADSLIVQSNITENKINSKMEWGNQKSSKNGKILSQIVILDETHFDINIVESFLKDTLIGFWEMPFPSTIKYNSKRFAFDTLSFKNGNQLISAHGIVGNNERDTIKLDIIDFQLEKIPSFFNIEKENFHLNGSLTSHIYLQSCLNSFKASTNCKIQNFELNNYEIGNFKFSSNWDQLSDRYNIEGELINELEHKEIILKNCSYHPNNEIDNRVKGSLRLNDANIDFLDPFLPNEFLSGLEGLINGELSVGGNWDNPDFNGELYFKNINLKLSQFNSHFNINGKSLVTKNTIKILNGSVKDELNVFGKIYGQFDHNNFSKYALNIGLDFDKPMLIMNNTYNENPYYYGKAYVTGLTEISYDKINDLAIKINAKTQKNTSLNIPLYGNEEVVLHDFISFKTNDSIKNTEVQPNNLLKKKLDVDIELEITEDAELILIFDDLVGDAMQSKGDGNIQLKIDENFDISMYGNYNISQGEYVFALKEFINKKFILNKGGEITWLGDPYNAKIDLSAIYPLRTSLYNILPTVERDNWKHKSLVDVYINLENDLMNPDVQFNVDVPKANESVKASLNSILSNNEELNKQVFSLLILNQFITPNHLNLGDNGKVYDISTSEMLSNQLGNMISSFTDEFDIGFDYSLGDPITNDKLTVAMSTQQFNDRLSIETNLGMSQSNNLTQNPNSFIGDVNVEYKLNSAGNIRIHAYNESNEYNLSNQNQSNYTQGVGISYKQSFNSLRELFCEMGNLFRSNTNNCND